jgi:hypothetical protein
MRIELWSRSELSRTSVMIRLACIPAWAEAQVPTVEGMERHEMMIACRGS